MRGEMPISILDLGTGRLPTSQFQDFHLQYAVQDIKNNRVLKNLHNSIETLFKDETVLFQMNTSKSSKSEVEKLYLEDEKVINFSGINLCKTPYTNYKFFKEFIGEVCEPYYSIHQNIQESLSPVKKSYIQEIDQNLKVTETGQGMCENYLKIHDDFTKRLASKTTRLAQINMLKNEDDESIGILNMQKNENNNKHKKDEFHISTEQMQFSNKSSSHLISEGNNESEHVSMLEEMVSSKSILAEEEKPKNHAEPLSISELNGKMELDVNENSRLMPISEGNNESGFLSISHGNNDLPSLPLSGNYWQSLTTLEGNDDSEYEEVNNNLKTLTDNVHNSDNFSNSVENGIQTRLDTSESSCLKDAVDIASCISVPSVVKSEQQLESDVLVINGICCDAAPQCSCVEADWFLENAQQEELPYQEKHSDLLHGKAAEDSSSSKMNEFSCPVKFSVEVQTNSASATLKNSMEGVLSENDTQYLFQADNERVLKGLNDSSRLVDLHTNNFDSRNVFRQRMSDEVKGRETTKLKEESSREIEEGKSVLEKDFSCSDNTALQINPSHCNVPTRLASGRNLYESSVDMNEASASKEHRRLASKEGVNVSSRTNVKLSRNNVLEKELSKVEKEWDEFKADSLEEPLSPEIPLVCSMASRFSEETKRTSSVEHSNDATLNESYIVVDEIDCSEAFTDTEEVKNVAVEKERVYLGNPASLRVKEPKDAENAEQPVKSYMQPFESSNPLENRDNEDPKWNYLKQLETDEARYQFSRSRWKSLVVPDPNKNCTLFSFRCRQKTQAAAQKSSKKRMLGAKEQTEGRPPNKRVCRLNHNFSDYVFDESIASVRNEYFNHCKRTLQIKRKLHEKLHMLEIAKSEVSVINRFYMGLPDQDLTVSQNILEQEQIDSNKLFEKFKNIYGWNGRLFVP